MGEPILSVVIPTRDPDPSRFQRLLAGLAAQSLPANAWELIIVDNASARQPGLGPLTFHPRAHIITEPRPGTLWARLAGLRAASAPVIFCLDDDTVPAPETADAVVDFMAVHPRVGIAGGRVRPHFESPPPSWLHDFEWALALRDEGNEDRIWSAADSPGLPSWTLVGASLVVRRAALPAYFRHVERDSAEILARSWRGPGIGSLEDQDLILCLLRLGWSMAWHSAIDVTHLIPSKRLEFEPFADLVEALNEMWMRTTRAFGWNAQPPIPPWTQGVRALRARLRLRAWKGRAEQLRWRSARGLFAGRARNFGDSFRYQIDARS